MSVDNFIDSDVLLIPQGRSVSEKYLKQLNIFL